MKNIQFLFLIIFIFYSCDTFFQKEKNSGNRVITQYYPNKVIKSKVEVKDTVRHGLTKNYDKNGKLESEITYSNGRKEGLSKSYYPSGKLHSVINYKNNIKEGEEIWYYENGNPYRINPFIKGKISGVQKWYYKNGKLMGEVPYKNGQPGIGLKEYKENGELITNYPSIIFKEINQIMIADKFILEISLSNKSKKVSFYFDDLDQGKFFNEYMFEVPIEKGIATMKYYVPEGFMKMEKINVVAKYRTNLGLPYITQRTYNLALQH